MRWLLDTHVWYWTIEDPDRLSPSFRESFVDPALDVRVSLASAWEIVIKHGSGKLRLGRPPEEYVPFHLAAQRVALQGLELDHVLAVASLPMHHRDPFDRLLIAQARAIGATIVTADRAIAQYDVEVLDPR